MLLISYAVCFLALHCCSLTAAVELPLTVYKPKYKEAIEIRDKNDLFNPKVARNVILFLIEGLDSHTIAAARKLVEEKTSAAFNKMSILDTFVTGFMKTPSRDFLVADPAAATSAFFNGLPEYNGQMGWVEQQDANCTEYDPSKKMMKNLFKVMSGGGKQTGLVTLSRLTSPGVAGTYASTPDMQIESDIHLRQSGCDDGKFEDVATQLIQHYKDLNVIIGAGRNYFFGNNIIDPLTKVKLQDSRSDMDLKSVWALQKSLRKVSNRQATGGDNVGAALQGLEKYLLGFTEERGEGGGLDLPFLVKNSISKLKANSDEKGYFLTVYDDTLATQHKESRAANLGSNLNTILKAVSDTIDSVDKTDTLIVVASTQGSTMTLSAGSLLDESITDKSRTEKCEPHLYLNYAFGTQQNAEYIDQAGIPDYQYLSLYNSEGVTGGADLPIYAKGPGSHAFTGVHEMAYMYHALLYATCLTSDAAALYQHCTEAAAVVTTTAKPNHWPTIPQTTPRTTTKHPIPWWQPTLRPNSKNPYSNIGPRARPNSPRPLPNIGHGQNAQDMRRLFPFLFG